MARFNFTNISLNDKADITQIMNNFNLIEANGALLTDVNAVDVKVVANAAEIATLKTNVLTNATNIGTKAPTNHASSNTTYGIGTASNYGHCKIANNLTTSSHSDGLVLSAYQGYVLNTAVAGKAPTNHASSATTYGIGSTSNYGHCKTVNGLTTSAHADGLALSAYQGKVLNDKINGKQKTISYGTAAPSGGSSGDMYFQYF